MKESYFWSKYLRPALSTISGIHFCRHEDSVTEGVPDVSYSCGVRSGWMELKALDNWPIRPTTKVRIKNLKDSQVEFLKRREQAGAHCWLVVCIGKDVLVFRGEDLPLLPQTKDELLDSAYANITLPIPRWWLEELILGSI